jgi:NAD(P)-dependent dehydrogenase (short-subunit alcohol dehydrogenase family)
VAKIDVVRWAGCLVTGSGSGIGRAAAVLLAARGTWDVVDDVSESRATETVDMICASGGQAVSAVFGVTSTADALVDSAISAFGQLDIVVNSARMFRAEMVLVDPALEQTLPRS